MSRTDPQFNLRIPESLRDKVMTAAKENKRSATAEILARLEASFAQMEQAQAELDLDGSPDHESASESSERRARGVNKQALIKSSFAGLGLTRKEFEDAVSSGIESALVGLGVFPQPPDNAKPQPNTGPKPRKRFTKE